MKKEILKKVNATMVVQLVNFENYKIDALQAMEEFVNKCSIPNKEEVLEEYKQHLQEQEETNQIVLGGKFNQYVLEYDNYTNNLIVKNVIDNSFGLGVKINDIDLDIDTLVDIDCSLNEQIEEYFADKIIEDCGEYWEIKE